MERIILIGYMGAGKTTIGKAVAENLGLQFFDLDWYIEDRFHTKIPEIFKTRGEEGFRLIEKSMLHEVAEFENVIISAGGGTPCFFDNIDYMNQQAKTVYLKASTDVLFSHLSTARTQRPLLANKTDEELRSFIEASLKEREPFYSKAKYILNIDVLENYTKIQESVNKLKQLLSIS